MKITKRINYFGTVIYENEYNLFHREDGPAIEDPGRCKEYWLNGKLHRENGPAVDISTGRKEYWLNNKRYDKIYNITSDEEWIELVPKILLLGE
jgi:hypothetical protein